MTMGDSIPIRSIAETDRAPPPAPHPFLIKVATRLLAKAERSESDRAIRLRLDRSEVPELYDHVDAEALRLLELLLNDLCSTGWVRLLLAKARDFAGFVDRNPQLELVNFDALADWAGYQRQADRWNRKLVAYLSEHWEATPSARQALLDYLSRSPVLALAEMSAEQAMLSLSALRTLCASGASMPLREASARVFQGRSKVLDSREELLRLFGASPGQFWEAPIQLLVDIPPAFDEALFVENLVTFEQMADRRRPDWSRSLLIYAAGFKGSAKRLRSRQGCRLYLRPTQRGEALTLDASAVRGLDAVGAWLFGRSELPVRFFGDLDFAGMQILASLREVFANAEAWRPGYWELVRVLSDGGGHLPAMASKERQTDPGATGCPYADGELLPLMRHRRRFVDQEVFWV